MKLPKLIDKEIYYYEVFSNPYLFEYQKNKTGNIKHLQCNKTYYSAWAGWDFYTDKTLTLIRLATSEEKHWLKECIKQERHITYDEAMESYSSLITKDDPELSTILIKLLTQ